MHEQTLRDILRRLNALERTSARVRVGEVTGTGPLDVALGGADTPYEDVAAVDGLMLDVGDRVGTLLWGNDLLVLGALGGPGLRFGTATLTFSASTDSAGVAVSHGLGTTPTVVLAMAKAVTFGSIPRITANSIDASNFTLFGEVRTALTGSVAVGWLALA